MILFFNGVAGKVVFDNRRPLPVKCLRFGTATPPVITEVVAPTAAEPQFVASSPKVTTTSPQSGGNRFLRAVRKENAGEAMVREWRLESTRRERNNDRSRNSANQRCLRRERRLSLRCVRVY